MALKVGLDVLPAPLQIILGILTGGLVAAIFAALIGIPVLRLKSDYLAIATLGFSEIIRAIISSPQMDKITNGSYGLKTSRDLPWDFRSFLQARAPCWSHSQLRAFASASWSWSSGAHMAGLSWRSAKTVSQPRRWASTS